MSEGLRSYLLSVVSACLLLTLIGIVLPDNRFRKLASVAGSLLVVMTVVSPVLSLNPDQIAQTVSDFLVETETARTQVKVSDRDLLSDIIKQRCEAYILDKASDMGLELQVEVVLSETGEYPYPTAVKIEGSMTPEEHRILSRYISEELGLPREQQEWL